MRLAQATDVMVTATRLASPLPVAPLVALVVLLGLVWSPIISRHADPAGILYVTPWLLWMPAACLVMAPVIGGWLGVAVAYVAIRGWFTATETAQWYAVYFAVGVLCLVLATRCPREWTRITLLACLSGQIAVSFLGWDAGTMLNRPALGGAIAAVLPLAPIALIPALAVPLAWSQSYLAGVAALVGILVAYPRSWPLLGGATALGLGVYLLIGFKSLHSTWVRLEVWQMGWTDLLHAPWVGYGPGGWALRMSLVSVPSEPALSLWAAHNEPLQWLYETGAVGAVLLYMVLRSSLPRIAQAPPMWRGAAAAVAVLSLGLQVFHYPTLAPVLILVLGGAMHGGSA